MGQQIKVYRDLEFLGNASHTGNVKGNFSTERVIFVDHFQDRILDLSVWNTLGQSAGAATHEAPHIMLITVGSSSDDEWCISTQLNYRGDFNSIFETRISNSDVTSLAYCVGLADAISYSGDVAMSYEGTTVSADSGCTDFAGFVFDPHADTDYIYGLSKNTSGNGSVISSAHTEANDSFATLRVELRDNGSTNGYADAFFYVNTLGLEINPIDDYIGMERNAVTRDSPLCAYVGCMSHITGTDNVHVDYVKVWSDPTPQAEEVL